MYIESNTKRIFAIACLGKKLPFHTEIKYLILKYSILDLVKELSKLKQTWRGVSTVYIESKTKKIAITCLGKKLIFHTEICY